ncbi:hypothetical protein KSS94_20310 [Pseudomonas fakonensis]|uniref:Uncharacterized protein n=1 Tax=Pseudomonas fakonensis TaxID=2842355 RepID=A0ABX8N1Q8_9PSED|nr:hypothetical protein [Pseudomonas fakonensis]QXH50272.1 hypothetical protein KSS94_20310 [Pseudomonas fakonensis]
MSIEDHPAMHPTLSGDAQVWVACTGWTTAQLQVFVRGDDSRDCALADAIGEFWLKDHKIEAQVHAPSNALNQLLAGFSDEATLIEHLQRTNPSLLEQPADTVIVHYGDGERSYESFVHQGIAFHKLLGPCPHTLNPPEVHSVTVKVAKDDQTLDITLHYSCYPHIMTTRIDGERYCVEGRDTLHCLSQLRTLTPGVRWLCKGAKRNVLPSRMSAQMSGGTIAYETTLGLPALRKDQVSIFDFDDRDIVDSIDEQLAFRAAWLQSLRGGD